MNQYPGNTKDPIKRAIYNPKEFRQGRSQRTNRPQRASQIRAAGPSGALRQEKVSRRWMAGIVVAGLAGGSLYGWSMAERQIQMRKVAPLPVSGEFQRFYPSAVSAPAPFKISAKNSAAHFFVKLEDWHTAAPVVTAFVRKGGQIALNVPLGEYRLKYASGTNWMGPGALFGSTTSSRQARSPMVFRVEGNQYLGHVLDLTPSISGNLHAAPIGVRGF